VGLVFLLCAGPAGCATYGAIAVYTAAQTALVAAGAVAVTGAYVAGVTPWQRESTRCAEYAARGIKVTEPQEARIPADEGEVHTFAPAFWRIDSERKGEAFPPRTPHEAGSGDAAQPPPPVEGTLAVTDRSVLLIPLPGTAGVRIPYEVVRNIPDEREREIEVHTSSVTGEPRSMIVRSCDGRSDVFTIWERQRKRLDPEAIAAAAATIKARVAAFRATEGKGTDAQK
jgi:hypothetical protein